MKVKDLVQIYHWQTDDYARHKASGELYDSLNQKLDKFVEAYQKNNRIAVIKGGKCFLKNMSGKSAKKLLEEFADYLTKLDTKKPDLLNIRDEMLADVNQTLYLFSLN